MKHAIYNQVILRTLKLILAINIRYVFTQLVSEQLLIHELQQSRHEKAEKDVASDYRTLRSRNSLRLRRYSQS